jgi:hypothetical protein
MAAVDTDLPLLADPKVGAEHLLGDGATDVLQAVLGSVGATVERHAPTQTAYQPGRSLTVVHRAKVRWPDGRRTDEDLGLAYGKAAPGGALVLGNGAEQIVAWRVPADPWLPGLAPVVDPAAVGELLAGVGYPVAGELRTHVRAYRAGRRAVVEVSGRGVRAFVKVVRPHKAAALHDAHVALAAHLPVPRSLGWSPEHGVVVLEALPGRTLRDALAGSFGLPGAGSLLAVLDRLPAPPSGAPRPLDWRAAEFAGLVAVVVPHLAARLDALVAGIAPYEERAAAESLVPVHGDFYEAQLMVDGGAVTGVLDVDTFGLGRRVDDLATMIGHLSVLALGWPQRRRVEDYAARLLDGFDQVVDPAMLRAAVAAVVLGLATGSFRVLDPDWAIHTERRVALAEAWLESARRVDEQSLTSAQGSPHVRPAS